LRLAIEALRNVNLARSLAEPNLTTLNGRPANFQAGGQFPVPVVTSGNVFGGLQGVQFVPFGVSLQFTPTITDKDRIRLQLSAEVSARDAGAGQTNFNGASVPSLTTRNFNSTVELRDGETIAIAGLIQNNFGSDGARVPLFGDIPLVGRAFGRQNTSCAEQELVVLVTPRLIHPLRGDLPPLPGSDMISPTDGEFYIHGRLQSRCQPKGRKHGAAACEPATEGEQLVGPHGYSEAGAPQVGSRSASTTRR
jgi:pilus assembly protein CpaC